MNKLQACEQRYANLKLLWERRVEESDRRLALLMRANYFLELVPIGMSKVDARIYYQLMDDIEKELSDGIS